MPNDEQTKMTLRLKRGLIEWIDAEADRRGISRSALIRMILTDTMAGRPVQIGG